MSFISYQNSSAFCFKSSVGLTGFGEVGLSLLGLLFAFDFFEEPLPIVCYENEFSKLRF